MNHKIHPHVIVNLVNFMYVIGIFSLHPKLILQLSSYATDIVNNIF